MQRIISLAAVALFLLPTVAAAHVTLRPRESKPGAEQKYKAPVPTGGQVAPVAVQPDIPDGVTTSPGQQAGDGHAAASSSGEATRIDAWLKGYDDAFNAKDLEKLGTFYHPQVTIYEGGGIDNGWAAYRDGHLGPELKAFENLQFGHSDRQIQMLGERAAYVVSTYTLKAKMGQRDIDSGGLETLILVKGDDGAWKIRHSHTSSRPRRPAEGGN